MARRMAIGLKTKSDIQFTRDVLESLGEWKRAAQMARAMIERYPPARTARKPSTRTGAF
jgi:hypothetical protein